MHLGKDSTCPPRDPSRKTMYSMRFCPFAERARLALALRCIEYERVDVQLRDDKPDWYFEVNPKGTVPYLIMEDGSVIRDSADIVEYAATVSDCCGHKMALETDEEKTKHEAAMAEFPNFHKKFYALCFSAVYFSDSDTSAEEHMAEYKRSLTFLENNITGPFYHGDDIKTTDLLIFPWIERIEAAFMAVGKQFDKAEFPGITAYYEKMAAMPSLKKEMEPADVHYRYSRTVLAGKREYEIK